MSDDVTSGVTAAPADDESMPWILRRAAERRADGSPTNGHAAAPDEPHSFKSTTRPPGWKQGWAERVHYWVVLGLLNALFGSGD